ncbi:MAG: DUF1922 domain-containing protein [Candidatus Helarchaeota archaeon]
MNQYKIFRCPNCQTLIYCAAHQKTRTCPFCQKIIRLKNQPILKVTNSLKETIFVIQKLKLPPYLRQEISTYQIDSQKSNSKRELFLQKILQIQNQASDQAIDEKLFIEELKNAGFPESWILKQLTKLDKQGLLIHLSKGQIKFLL